MLPACRVSAKALTDFSWSNDCAKHVRGASTRDLETGSRVSPVRMKPTVHPPPPCVVTIAPEAAIATTAARVRSGRRGSPADFLLLACLFGLARMVVLAAD